MDNTKVISPGIFLHKQQSQPRNDEILYTFKVQVDRLNIVEFTADFSGSENIILENRNSLVSITKIMPYQTETVAKLILKKDWKLKSKFRFSLKMAPKEYQLKYIQEDNQKLHKEIILVTNITSKFPIQIMNMQEINQIMAQYEIKFIDPEFLPIDDSIFPLSSQISSKQLDSLVQWRRPNEFFDQDLGSELCVCSPNIDPLDIHKGQLEDMWLLSTIAVLAERQSLIERLIITREINPFGVYKVKLCKNGEWITVTIDDLIPCYPKSGPIFSKTSGNEIWLLLLEKAYAKLNGGYMNLRFGEPRDAFIDFTGCPTDTFLFQESDVFKRIKDGSFWNLMVKSEQEGYLLSTFTNQNIGVVDQVDNDFNNINNINQQKDNLHYQSFAIIGLKQIKDGTKLINLRNPFGNFEWKGDWSDTSKLWTPEVIQQVHPQFQINDGNFWMSFNDFVQHFAGVNICKVRNWDEVRIKGKFVRVQDIDDTNIEVVMSKWYYAIDIPQDTNLILGIHQECQRYTGVSEKRPYIDLGLAIFKRVKNNQLESIQIPQPKEIRQLEISLKLEVGSYIILPRTTGCNMRRAVPKIDKQQQPPPASLQQQQQQVMLMTHDGKLSDLLLSTLHDIFRKFDMLLTRELTYIEFKGFFECLNKKISQNEFEQNILKIYPSTQKGLSFKGFVDFFRDSIKQFGEEHIWLWLEMLGYDRELFSVRSRCFILSLHCDQELSVIVKDAIQTDLDNRANFLYVSSYGEEIKLEKQGVRIFFAYNQAIQAYTYIAINDLPETVEVMINCSKSMSALFSTKDGSVKKRIEPGQLEFMMHLKMDNKTNQNFKLFMECKWTIIKKNLNQQIQQ